MTHRLQLTLRRVALAASALLVTAMAAATFVEHAHGTAAATHYIYNSPWFVLLWAAAAAAGTALLLARRRPVHVLLLHGALVLILIGALLSMLTAREGTMHLRAGTTTDAYETTDTRSGTTRIMHLPYRVRLENFSQSNHAGGEAPAAYAAQLRLTGADGGEELQTVSLNAAGGRDGVRLFLRSFDSDRRGVTLSLRADRAGMTVSYTGYALLALGLAGMMLSRRGVFRRALRTVARQGAAAALLLLLPAAAGHEARAARTLPANEAEAVGRLLVVSGGRVCPVQTLALDFTRKLYGSDSYGGYSAEQVLMGWLFWPEEWEREPMIRVKSAALRREYGLERHASFLDFFASGYRLGPLVARHYAGERGGLPEAAAEVDDRLGLVYDLRRGTLFKMFPVRRGGEVRWLPPTEPLQQGELSAKDSVLVREAFVRMSAAARGGDGQALRRVVAETEAYQQAHGAESLPEAGVVKAERLYNRLNPVGLLSRLHLAAGLALLALMVAQMAGRLRRGLQAAQTTGVVLAGASLVALTLHTALRCYVSGRLPLANAYETLLTVAWTALAVALTAGIAARRRKALRVVPALGLLLSGAFLLVAGLGEMNPQITPLVPVLASPLLSLHVSLVMPAYALLGLTFLCAVAAVAVRLAARRDDEAPVRRAEEGLQALSRVMLVPALVLLAAGIFTGAVWAGESWGRYWGWDPKETWALVTLLVYALPLHTASVPRLRSPRAWHAYMLGAFLTVLMTYFGVNYWLTGLHSYAG